MEEDIQNYLPTVMFRGTPCIISQDRIEIKIPNNLLEKELASDLGADSRNSQFYVK